MLLIINPKNEIIRKPFGVLGDGLIEDFRFNAVEVRKIMIKVDCL